jgi:hypothetical protein
MKEFTRSQIKTGMRVKLRNGIFYIAMTNTGDMDTLVREGRDGLLSLEYGDSMLCAAQYKGNYDIMEIYEAPSFFKGYFVPEDVGPLLWSRGSHNDPSALEIKDNILRHVSDLVLGFSNYDRRECESLTEETLDKAFENGTVTVDDCVDMFREKIAEAYPKK